MRSAIITTESGHTWHTAINGTDAQIRAYFLGKRFNVGSYPEENMEHVCAVHTDDDPASKTLYRIHTKPWLDPHNLAPRHAMPYDDAAEWLYERPPYVIQEGIYLIIPAEPDPQTLRTMQGALRAAWERHQAKTTLPGVHFTRELNATAAAQLQYWFRFYARGNASRDSLAHAIMRDGTFTTDAALA